MGPAKRRAQTPAVRSPLPNYLPILKTAESKYVALALAGTDGLVTSWLPSSRMARSFQQLPLGLSRKSAL